MVATNSETKVIQLSGILDSASGNQLRRDIADWVDRGVSMIAVDFTNVDFMDSSGLGALVVSLKKVREIDGRLALCAIHDQVRMLLELTSLETVFEIFPNLQEFEQSIKS
jgi:anti-anti-sigma factor